MPTYDLAPLLRETRQVLGLSQRRLASILGISYGTLQRWEYDETIPQPGYREWVASELRRLQRTMPHRVNRRLISGSRPGPKNIWSKLQRAESINP